jgi:hypothetical protein
MKHCNLLAYYDFKAKKERSFWHLHLVSVKLLFIKKNLFINKIIKFNKRFIFEESDRGIQVGTGSST